MSSPTSLLALPDDALHLVASFLFDALLPLNLNRFASAAAALRALFATVLAELRFSRKCVRCLCCKAGTTLRALAPSRKTRAPMTQLVWIGKRLSTDDAPALGLLLRTKALSLRLLSFGEPERVLLPDPHPLPSLLSNQIGDRGAREIAAAAASGGCLTRLKKLSLYSNKIGDAGVRALASACRNGALAQLTMLLLNNNQIGDAGIACLFDAAADGALPMLEWLFLNKQSPQRDNASISDVGFEALVAAVAGGALPKLVFLGFPYAHKRQWCDTEARTQAVATALAAAIGSRGQTALRMLSLMDQPEIRQNEDLMEACRVHRICVLPPGGY
jgi:hypothetical protein